MYLINEAILFSFESKTFEQAGLFQKFGGRAMFLVTIIFSCLFSQGTLAQRRNGAALFWHFDYFEGNVDPTAEWDQKYKEDFYQLGLRNFSFSAAHMLHDITVEDARNSLNIDMPLQNGIPTSNSDLSTNQSGIVLPNVPSRPNAYSSPGGHAFFDFMDYVTDPNWMRRGNKLERLLHVYHMHETWEMARKAANNFSGVSEDICIGALDHVNNGIEKGLTVIFHNFNHTYGRPNDPIKPLTWEDNGESWTEWKATLPAHTFLIGTLKSMGLYTQCLMRKFGKVKRPIGLDGCCDSKMVGGFNYTKVKYFSEFDKHK